MIISIPVYEGVDLLDITVPHEVFKWMDASTDIRLVAPAADTILKSRDGFRFLSTHAFSREEPTDVLWVPGGDPKVLARLMRDTSEEGFLGQVRRIAARATWVCSVCEGALLLAAAGLLDGYEATTHWEFLPCLRSFDKVTVADGFPRFHLDRNRLTGGGISSGLDESLELVRLLQGDGVARRVQRTMQYYPQPPFPSDLHEPPTCGFPGLTQN